MLYKIRRLARGNGNHDFDIKNEETMGSTNSGVQLKFDINTNL